MDQLLSRSREIIEQATRDYQPYAIVMMFSGGNDSLTAYNVARALDVPLTHFLHGITGTGIPETTQFCRQVGEKSGLSYIEANAGKAFEKAVWKRGFYGRGIHAHKLVYHVLKKIEFERTISRHIRQGKRGRNVLLVNGVRWQESPNRERLQNQPIRADASNIWVNIVNDWSRLDCANFLADYPRNPVTELLHRSGECMCGTMQSQEERKEAAFWFPHWGKWLDDVERAVRDKFGWGWGETIPAWFSQSQKGQLFLPDFQPMCQNCVFAGGNIEA